MIIVVLQGSISSIFENQLQHAKALSWPPSTRMFCEGVDQIRGYEPHSTSNIPPLFNDEHCTTSPVGRIDY